jgi:hypothetical protein
MTRNIPKRLWLRVFIASISLVLLIFGLLYLIVTVQRWTFETNIRNIQVGDTKERVVEALGEPRERFARGGQLIDHLRKQNLLVALLTAESPETWVYGSWSLLRLGPTDRDHAIEFDEQGRVSRVVMPTKSEEMQ